MALNVVFVSLNDFRMSKPAATLWNVYPWEKFLPDNPPSTFLDKDITDLEACLFLQVTDLGESEGCYRFALYEDQVSINIPGFCVSEEKLFRAYVFCLNYKTSDIQLQNNSWTTDWYDVSELINSKKISVEKATGFKNPASEEFIAQLQEVQKSHPETGLSLRWAMLSTSEGHIDLALQCLPVNADILKCDTRTLSANFPTVIPISFRIYSDIENFSVAKGLKTLLFARKPFIAKENLERNPEGLISGKL
jgi:hypothetical protein